MTPAPDIRIQPYQPKDRGAFRDLNEQWIVKYFTIEDQDRTVLHDPESHVLKPGGHIFMAFANDRPIGCCALVFVKPDVFELAKMAIAEGYRGRGIGRKLLEHTIAQARSLGARSLCLASNTVLANAVHLYESIGFRHLPPERAKTWPYARCNVFMELEL